MKKGSHHSRKTREKLSKLGKGKTHSEKTKKKLSELGKGRTHSKETKRKMSSSRMGMKLSKETRKKLSLYRTGKKLSEETKKKMTHQGMKGKHHSEITKRKISLSHKGKKVKLSEETRKKRSLAFTGEKNPNWKGGITPQTLLERTSNKYLLWRDAVFRKDNFTCQKTGIKGGFEAHHINNFSSFPELRFNVNNGITLSIEAHIEFHKLYGKTNNTKEQLEAFLGRQLNTAI